MGRSALAAQDDDATSPEASSRADPARLRRLIADHFDVVWRTLRRLGVIEHRAEDAAQEVFLVASRKIGPVAPSRERAFLFAIAFRVAADERRLRRRRPDGLNHDELLDVADHGPLPDELVERRMALALVDGIVATLPAEVRTVFVMFEIEEMSMIEIAELLELRPGTVASRLRRGRELFEAAVARHASRRGLLP